MSMTLTENDLADLKEGLRRCSPETIEAAIRFPEKGEVDAITTIVFGILDRYQPAKAPIKLSEANEDTRLIEDIGLDSLTLLEIVLSIEKVLKLRIENEELREIRTLGQLNKFLHAKITGAKPESPAKHYTREQIVLTPKSPARNRNRPPSITPVSKSCLCFPNSRHSCFSTRLHSMGKP